jgi:hypothetical protein
LPGEALCHLKLWMVADEARSQEPVEEHPRKSCSQNRRHGKYAILTTCIASARTIPRSTTTDTLILFASCRNARTLMHARVSESQVKVDFKIRYLTLPGFMLSFFLACSRSERHLINLPEEWVPYVPAILSRTTQTPSSTTKVASSDSASSTPPPPSTVTIPNSITTSDPSMSSSAVEMTQAATVSQAAAQPSSTNWADHQKPICGVCKLLSLSLD